MSKLRHWFAWLLLPDSEPPTPPSKQNADLALVRGIIGKLADAASAVRRVGKSWEAARDEV